MQSRELILYLGGTDFISSFHCLAGLENTQSPDKWSADKGQWAVILLPAAMVFSYS